MRPVRVPASGLLVSTSGIGIENRARPLEDRPHGQDAHDRIAELRHGGEQRPVRRVEGDESRGVEWIAAPHEIARPRQNKASDGQERHHLVVDLDDVLVDAGSMVELDVLAEELGPLDEQPPFGRRHAQLGDPAEHLEDERAHLALHGHVLAIHAHGPSGDSGDEEQAERDQGHGEKGKPPVVVDEQDEIQHRRQRRPGRWRPRRR